MASLRETLAEHGFESNDDYDFQMRCLLDSPASGIRALNIEGDGERRKTAFANALASALGIRQVLYHDFTAQHPPTPEVILPPSRDELGREEPPIDPLDQTVSEACAQSEGEPTALILDQLQAADFREHIRIHHLLSRRYWSIRDARYVANARHLLVLMISEAPLYHALQKESFRVWVGRLSERQVAYRPDAFGLDSRAEPLFEALTELFERLGNAPTPSEMGHILSDLRLHVRTLEHLRLSLFGRAEGVERPTLGASEVAEDLGRVLERARELFAEEHLEIGGD